MPYEEYDRLAWGLTKDEIRRLLKPREALGFEETISKIIKPDGIGYYREQGALSDGGLKKVRDKILSGMQTRLGTFGHTKTRARVEEQGGMMDVDGVFAWDFKEMGFTDCVDSAKDRHEKFLELRHLNIAVGKRKLITDILTCFVLVNQHTLYRMLQRGATNREPLALLCSKFDDWAGLAAMFMMSHRFLGDHIGHTVLIPFCGGALLGKIAFTEDAHTEQGWDRHKLRLYDSILKGHIRTAPYESVLENEFQGMTGSVTLQITTWVPDEYFHPEQWWAHEQMEKFASKHKDIINYCFNTIYGRHSGNKTTHVPKFSDSAEQFGTDLGRIFADPRWATACQWR